MSALRSLRITLGQTNVGSLLALDDGRVYFRFDEAYANDPMRPTLSQIYVGDTEETTRLQLLDPFLGINRGPGGGVLPPFFANLLPEGQLRVHLIERAGIAKDDQFGLLAYCGKSLPGNVYALSENLTEIEIGRLLGQDRDSYEMSSFQLPTPEGESLSGVQPKVSLVKDATGRYVMRSKDDKGKHFIGKLPSGGYDNLPAVEHASLTLAAAAGLDVCEHELLPQSAIGDLLPFTMRNLDEPFLLVHRFDRDAPTPNGRLHMEDFAQGTATLPDMKYKGTYAAIGRILLDRSSTPDDDILELVRRIKVGEMLGNYDAHLKNFSLLYSDPQKARLSPAYDIVAYCVYHTGRGHALHFTPNQKQVTLLTPVVVRELANLWEFPETKLTSAITDVVNRAMTTWPALIEELPFTDLQRDRLIEHIESNPSVDAWRRRQVRSKFKM